MKLHGTRRKGQFLLISAVVIGILLISASSTVAEIQSQEFEHDPTAYDLNLLKHEAEKVNTDKTAEQESFREMVDSIPEYSSTTTVWRKDSEPNCFNVTLRKQGSIMQMNCIG